MLFTPKGPGQGAHVRKGQSCRRSWVCRVWPTGLGTTSELPAHVSVLRPRCTNPAAPKGPKEPEDLGSSRGLQQGEGSLVAVTLPNP